MSRRSMTRDEGNRLYQRHLAAALVASLGFDAAVEVCQGNQWQGILGVLLAERPTAQAGALGQRRRAMDFATGDNA
ncbi:MAG: hypothetical protein ACE5LF_02575 [Alphaproteobacteria bacterium]